MGYVGKCQFDRTISEGKFTKVKIALDTETGGLVAIKILDKKNEVLKHKMVEQVTLNHTIWIIAAFFNDWDISHLVELWSLQILLALPLSVFTFWMAHELCNFVQRWINYVWWNYMLLMKKLHGQMQVKREISTTKLIMHPNVVQIYEVPFLIFYLILQSFWSEKIQVRNSQHNHLACLFSFHYEQAIADLWQINVFINL